MTELQLGVGVGVFLSILGCSGTNRLVGTWEAEGKGENGIKGTTITFSEDDTYVTASNLNGKSVSTRGTYTIDGETLTMTLQNIEGLSGKAQMRSAERLSKGPSVETATIEWKSDTEIVIVSSTGQSILKRKG